MVRAIPDTARSTGKVRTGVKADRADSVARAVAADHALEVDEKTTRLRALRLAREAAERELGHQEA